MAQHEQAAHGRFGKHYPAPSPSAFKIGGGCLVGLLVELVLLLIKKYYARGNTFGFVYGMVLVLAIVGAVGFVYFLVCAIRAKQDASSLRLFAAMATSCLGACLTFVIMRLWWISGLYVTCALWGGAAVLYVLNQIYHREFVFVAGLTGLFAVGAFVNYKAMAYGLVSSITLTVTVAVVLAAAVTAILTALAAKNGGKLMVAGHAVTVFVIPSSKVVLYVTCLVAALCAIAALFVGAAFCYYCFFVALAWLLLSAAYYTIRLM